MKEHIKNIKDRLTELEGHQAFPILDFGDLGNEIGIVIGTLTPDEIRDFINGLEHGISLTNGTHDDLDSPRFIHIRAEVGIKLENND